MSQSNLAPTTPGVARSTRDDGAVTPGSAVPKSALAAGGVLAVLASFCCGPMLLLASLGLGSAWLVSGLETLMPLRPYLIGATFAVLGFAGWRIHRPAAACASDAACAMQKTRAQHKFLFWVVAALALALIAFPYYATLFV